MSSTLETSLPLTRVLRIRPVLPCPVDTAEELWCTLAHAIDDIQKKRVVEGGVCFEELYRTAYNLVLIRRNSTLYANVKSLVDSHLTDIRTEVLGLNGRDVDFVQMVLNAWQDHCSAMNFIADILMYLDKVDVTRLSRPSIRRMGCQVFRDVFLTHETIQQRTSAALLEAVMQGREHETRIPAKVSDLLKILLLMDQNNSCLYEAIFEKPFLERLNQEVVEECQCVLLNSLSIMEYIEIAEENMKTEIDRVRSDVSQNMINKLRSSLEEVWIEKQLLTLVTDTEFSFWNLLDEYQFDLLNKVFTFFSRVTKGFEHFVGHLTLYLRKKGHQIVETAGDNPLHLIRGLINLKDTFDVLLERAFHNCESLSRVFLADFTYIVNLSSNLPNYLCQFIHKTLQKEEKLSENIDVIFDRCITLFRYIDDKDIFEFHYKYYLARRLLSDKLGLLAVEKTMISKLKEFCGEVFTDKLEAMIRDMEVSEAVMTEFRNVLHNQTVDLQVRVLTAGGWPMRNVPPLVNLPDEVASEFQTFIKFYQRRYSGRMITLQPDLGFALVSADFSRFSPTSKATSSQFLSLSDKVAENQTGEASASCGGGRKLTAGGKHFRQYRDSKKVALSLSMPSLNRVGRGAPIPAAFDEEAQTPVVEPEDAVTDETEDVEENVKPQSRRYILQVSSYQMCILTLFNQATSYTVEEIKHLTNTPYQELVGCLATLVNGGGHGSQPLLLQLPPRSGETGSGGFEPEDCIALNPEFTSRYYRVRLANRTLRDTELLDPARLDSAGLALDDARKYATDAAIIRVLKARKLLHHAELVAGVCEQLAERFRPNAELIASRIDRLEERKFLKKSEDAQVYTYVC